MSTVRRRVLRPTRPANAIEPINQARIHKRQAQLEMERQALSRWMGRLRRAFHAMERQQKRIVRLERDLTRLGSHGTIEQLRADLQHQEIIVVVGRLSDHLKNDAGWNAVRAAQEKIAADYRWERG